MRDSYDDIINMERPVSRSHTPMPIIDRAAQFASFAALTGYEDTVEEVARLTSKRIDLDEYEIELIDRELQYISDNLSKRERVEITYFIPDAHKSGGAYKTVTDIVEKIDDFEKIVILSSGAVIPICQIVALEIKNK